MSEPNMDLPRFSATPPGVTTDFLIEPSYVDALGWRLSCVNDRLTLKQLTILIGRDAASNNVFGSFLSNEIQKTIPIRREAKAISQYFAEMVGGDVCVFDLPNTFLICVLEGDITIFASTTEKIDKCIGYGDTISQTWKEIAPHLRSDIRARLIAKYGLPQA